MPIRRSGFEFAAIETLASPERYSGLFRTVTGAITDRLPVALRWGNPLPRAATEGWLVFLVGLIWFFGPLAESCARTARLTANSAIIARAIVMNLVNFI